MKGCKISIMDISVVIIAKNEEKMIADCCRSVAGWADEVILIDGESEDNTIKVTEQICKENGQTLHVYKNNFDDFSKQRWYGCQKAKGKWILYLDADERVTPELKQEILALIKSKTKPTHSAYFIKRENYYFGQKWSKGDRIQRLFLREQLKGWQGKIHETPIVKGTIGELENFITHYTHRDLITMLEKTNKWSETEADLLYKANHPKMGVLRFMKIIARAFLLSYIKEEGWRNGAHGLMESMFQTYSAFITYAKLYEKQIKNTS